MRPERLNSASLPAYASLQETVAGLNAVVMLGSCLHASPSAQDVAELAAGGVAAVTRLPLAAVAWFPSEPDGPLVVTGPSATRLDIATALRRLCPRLLACRPTRLDADEVPRPLRRAGVESLFALPLRVSTEPLGFLLAGGERGCVPVDLTLVQALGAQISTALYVARVRECETRRAQQLGELAAELRTQGDLLARALGLQEELIDLVLRGKDARTIVEHLAERLEAPIWLLDSDRRVLAHGCGGSSRKVAFPRESELARVLGGHHPDHDPRSLELATATGVRPFLVQSVATDRETFGYLMVGATELGSVDRTTFHGGRLVLALRLLIERSVAEAEERLGRDLIQDVLQRGDGAVPVGLAVRLGYENDGPAAVLALRLAEPAGAAAADRARQRIFAAVRAELSGGNRGLAGVIGDDVVVIVRSDGADRCAQRLLDRVAAVLPTPATAIGISDPRPRLGNLEPAYREALVAVAMAGRSPSRLLRFADLGLHRLLFDADNVDRVEEHIERWIGPLLRYDAQKRARLVETLSCYLAGDGQQDTARMLAIHPSTLKYRLGRIRSLLGTDFGHADTRFNIELALRLSSSMRTLSTS